MGNFKKSLYPIFLLIFTLFIVCSCQKNEVKLHYLGHSAVFLEFNEKVTVLCDYGKENAYLEWGWDSPIYDAGMPGPDLLCYSHFHDDHFDEERASHYDVARISGKVDTCIKKLKIITEAEAIRKEELDKVLRKIGPLEEDKIKAIEYLSSSIMNKLIHPPTAALKAEQEDRDIMIDIANRLFKLETEENNGDKK